MNPQQIRFCLQRPEKAIHCQQLGITHFIDDRLDVLGHLRHCVEKRYLFGEQTTSQVVPSTVTPVLTWPATVKQILADLNDARRN